MVILGMVMVVMVISSETTDACRDGQHAVMVNEKGTILNCSLPLSSEDHLVKIEWRRDTVVIFYYDSMINHQLEASEGYKFFGNIQSGDASLAIEYVYAVKFRSFSCKLTTWRKLYIDNAFCLLSGSGGTRHPTTALTANNPSKQNDVGGTSSPRVSIGGGKVYIEDWVWIVIAAVGFVVLVIIIALLAVWIYRRNQQRIIERYNNRRTSELQESMSYINIKDVPEEFLYEN